MLQCIYTGEIEVDAGNIISYYKTAKALEIQALLDALALTIKER